MQNNYLDIHSQENFNRARKKAFVQRIAHFLKPHKYNLLSLEEVKTLLRPRRETYRGIKAVSIDLIVGSEGRYRDFNREFLPRHNHLRPRWQNIDKLQLRNVILPPIQLYEVGGVYFVRDGNHRVSVSRSQGGEMIDAEVVSLDSFVSLSPDMDKNELKRAVINYEQRRFEEKTRFSSIIPEYSLKFTCTGRYNEVLFHILEHKYSISQDHKEELPLSSAVSSWFNTVYLPVLKVIKEYALLTHFPSRTEGDLYVWISKQWHLLKEQYGDDVEILRAAEDVVQKEGMKLSTEDPALFSEIFPMALGGSPELIRPGKNKTINSRGNSPEEGVYAGFSDSIEAVEGKQIFFGGHSAQGQ